MNLSRMMEAMRDAGHDHGIDAARWWEQDTIGGRASVDTRLVAAAYLQGIEDGDPAVIDSLPHLDLSGQWADGPTASDLYDTAMSAPTYVMLAEVPAWDDLPAEVQAELTDAYADAHAEAVVTEVERLCLATQDEARS